MKVKDLMTRDPISCAPDTTLAEAASLLWQRDCGVLPIVDDGELTGIITDRDMYIALATRNERAAHVRVGAVTATVPVTCAPDDDVHAALATMKRERVRRLPVVGLGRSLVGMLSMNDIVLAAGPKKAVTSDEVVDVLQAICAHRPIEPHVVAA